jgi:Ca2+-binding EF-hand superfamily protein
LLVGGSTSEARLIQEKTIMAKTSWAIALCLLTASAAFAQAPRGRNPGDEFGEEAPRGQRGERGDRGGFGRGEGGRGSETGEDGGRGFGRGGFGGRRGNPLFSALDTDGDGSISKAELRKAVANLAKLDADGDGNITQEEAGAGGPGGPGGPMGGMGDPAQMVDRMMSADQNGDGKLTPDEVDPRMGMMLRGADTDGDGAVSKEELTAAMQQMQQRMGGGQGGGFGGPQGFGGRGGNDMTAQFMAMDKNGDGKITPDEAPEQARAMLRQADADGNGEVDAREMAQFSRQMGGRMRGAVGGAQGQGGPGSRFGRGADAEGDADAAPRRTRRGRDDSGE